MDNREFLNKLNNFKELRIGGKPRQDWKSSNKEILMSQIRSQSSNEVMGAVAYSFDWLKVHFRMSELFVRPIGVLAIIAMLVLGSSVMTVRASKDSMPGDTLYNVKLATEKAHVGITFNQDKKARLEISFAERRVQELSQVIKEKNNEKTELAIRGLEKNLKGVQSRVEKMSLSEESEKAVEVAKEVNTKTKEFEQSLSNEEDEQIQEALEIIDEANTSALVVIVDWQQSGQDGDLTDEVEQDLENKIKKMEDKIQELDQGTVQTDIIKEGEEQPEKTTTEIPEDLAEEVDIEEAETKINEAKDLLEQDDYSGVLVIIGETEGIISGGNSQEGEESSDTEIDTATEKEVQTDMIKE